MLIFIYGSMCSVWPASFEYLDHKKKTATHMVGGGENITIEIEKHSFLKISLMIE